MDYIKLDDQEGLASILPTKTNIMAEVDAYMLEQLVAARPSKAVPDNDGHVTYVSFIDANQTDVVRNFFRKARQTFEGFSIPTSYGDVNGKLLDRRYAPRSEKITLGGEEKVVKRLIMIYMLELP
jgi:hypothetical protein